METSEKVVLREQPEIKDLLQTLMKQGLKKEQRRSYPIVLTSIQILRMVYETRADASSRMSADQISDVALSLEYVKQYGEAHKELNYKQACLLEQCVARRSYNLYSDVQRGENVVVEIPVQAGEKKFKYEQKVKLVNPKLYGRGYAIGDMGHTDYVLLADDIVAVEEK